MNKEILGIIATVFVLLSFVVVGEKRIRLVNILGAGMFVVYGLSIDAFSVWIMNGMLIVIHLIRIKQMEGRNEN